MTAERCATCGRFFRMADPDGRCDSCRQDAEWKRRDAERHARVMSYIFRKLDNPAPPEETK